LTSSNGELITSEEEYLRNSYENKTLAILENLENKISVVSESSEFTVYCITCPSLKVALKAMNKGVPKLKAMQKLDNEYNNAKKICTLEYGSHKRKEVFTMHHLL